MGTIGLIHSTGCTFLFPQTSSERLTQIYLIFHTDSCCYPFLTRIAKNMSFYPSSSQASSKQDHYTAPLPPLPSRRGQSSQHSTNRSNTLDHPQDEPPPYYLTPRGYYMGQDATAIENKKKRIHVNNAAAEASSCSNSHYLEETIPMQQQQQRDVMPPYSSSILNESRQKNTCCGSSQASCWRVFWLILSIVILSAGIGMVAGSGALKNVCDVDCGGGVDIKPGVVDRCSVVCADGWQKGLLYGGIVVMILSGLWTLWLLLICCINPCIQRRQKRKEHHQQNDIHNPHI